MVNSAIASNAVKISKKISELRYNEEKRKDEIVNVKSNFKPRALNA